MTVRIESITTVDAQGVVHWEDNGAVVAPERLRAMGYPPAAVIANREAIERQRPVFNEADCGGVFDGTRVHSDAESCL
jgi:hypothetical protein